VGGIVRYELSKVLTPIIEENFAKSESRNEALLLEMKSVVERSATDFRATLSLSIARVRMG
jgi:hypothetical protein